MPLRPARVGRGRRDPRAGGEDRSSSRRCHTRAPRARPAKTAVVAAAVTPRVGRRRI